MAYKMTVKKIRKPQLESRIKMLEGEFRCVHCGHISPKTAPYCLECGRTPYPDDIALDLGRPHECYYE